ncbi:MAG TPA: hypothetical protein VLF67_02235 [Candidatus Saccharimonas sp.]|nr:hypothetical protein [Candidatus Saccharimonas sp.]
MRLPDNPNELKKLVELAYLGEWVINSHHDHEYQDEAAIAALQRLLEAAGLPEIEQDIETGQYFLPASWTDRIYDDYVLDYDDHVFWDELIERLAQRDLARRRGVPIEDINRDDDVTALRPLEERYRRLLEQHGLDRLELPEDF